MADALPPWQGKAVLLIDLDAFFASVEQLDHPAWRKKPVIVGGDPRRGGVVSTASYEARAFGVRSAMPSSTAANLCPHAIWTEGHPERYRSVSEAAMDILIRESPHIQQVSIDEAFLDVTPTPYRPEHPAAVAERIQKAIGALGVSCSIGLGTTKTVAKVASDRDKPRGLTVVYPGCEAEFLRPLPIRCMSGIGAVAERALKSHNIHTLGELSQADDALLLRIFGKNAAMMRTRSLGGDLSPVRGGAPAKSVSNELTFATDLTTAGDVEAAIASMAAKVGRRLRKRGLKGHTVMLKLRFGDRSIRTVQKHLDTPTDDDLSFAPLLARLARDIWDPGTPVRLIGVGVSGFSLGTVQQEALFGPEEFTAPEERPGPLLGDEGMRAGLLKATDRVKNRFGEGAVYFGSEIAVRDRTTGSPAKNPEDYR